MICVKNKIIIRFRLKEIFRVVQSRNVTLPADINFTTIVVISERLKAVEHLGDCLLCRTDDNGAVKAEKSRFDR